MGNTYNRSEIYSFCELSEAQQKSQIDMYGNEDYVLEGSYVLYGNEDNPEKCRALGLFNFMRTESKIWDGVYGTSHSCGYFVKLDKSNSEALVARRWF